MRDRASQITSLWKAALALLVLALTLPACGSNSTTEQTAACGPYPDAESSPYVLPFPVGISARVFQENCGTFTHFGQYRHCTDFALEDGDTVILKGYCIADNAKRIGFGEAKGKVLKNA